MRMLAWKEWSENRLIVVAMGVLTLLLMLADVVYSRQPAWGYQRWASVSGLTLLLAFVWLLSTVIAGSSLVAPEVGSGTLVFLSNLPVSRSRVWWLKVRIGAALSLASIVVSTLVFIAVCDIGEHLGFIGSSGGQGVDWSSLAIGAALLAPVFAIASLVSTLFDRTISAFVCSVLSAVAIVTGIGEAASLIAAWLHRSGDQTVVSVMACFLIVTTVLCLFLSHRIFACGESLTTSKRFLLLMVPTRFLISAAIIGGATLISIVWLLT